MERLLGIGVLVQIVVCALVGVRLLALARRTREVPEFAFGIAFVALGAFGYPLSIAARAGAGGSELSGVLLSTALAAQNASALCIAVGTWRTFRPETRWLAGLLVAVALAFIASLVGHGLTVGFAGATDGGAWYYLGFWLRSAAFLWSYFEATRYSGFLRKRLRLGLADPLVANRIRLWSWSNGCICVGFAIFFAGRVASINVGTSPPVLALISAVSLVAAITMTLAFFPPLAYRRWVTGESELHR